MGHTLLFAFGAWPPHDGVRRVRRLNLFHDLGVLPQVLDSHEIALPIVPTGTIRFTLSGSCVVFDPVVSALRRHATAMAPLAGSLPQRNSALSLHMRWRMTTSLRATATRARAMPRRLATFIPHARRLDHLLLRTSSVCAALVECGTGEFVTAATDFALNVLP